MFLLSKYFLILIIFTLLGCGTLDYFSSDEKVILKGKRLDIIRFTNDLIIDEDAKNTPINLEDKFLNLSWEQLGDSSSHSAGNFLINSEPKFFWKERIGDGEGSYNKIFSQPVGNENSLFVLDAEGLLVALNLEDGEVLWEVETIPVSESLNSNIDGGLALKDDNLIVSNSYGDVINLSAKNGNVIWRVNNNKPAQGSPAIYDNNVYQMTIHNEIFVYDIDTGEEVWRYTASFVSAISNGGTSPAINEKVVIFPSNTGELISLNKSTGTVIWNTNLVIEGVISGALELTDIDSGPVIHNDLIFASSMSGVFAAVDLLSGSIIWDVIIKTSNNPIINGNSVFILSDDGKLINFIRNSGKIRWINDLRYKVYKESDNEKNCFGPLLAADVLWIVCNDKKVLKIDTVDGSIKDIFKIRSSSSIAPIVIKDMLIFYTNEAEVITYR